MQKFETLARPLFLSLALILGLAALSSRACDGDSCNYGYNQYRPRYSHENYSYDRYGRRVVVIVEEPRKEIVVQKTETVVAPVVKTETIQKTEVVQPPVLKQDVVQQPIVTEAPKVVTEAPTVDAPKVDAPKVDAPIETANKEVPPAK